MHARGAKRSEDSDQSAAQSFLIMMTNVIIRTHRKKLRLCLHSGWKTINLGKDTLNPPRDDVSARVATFCEMLYVFQGAK